MLAFVQTVSPEEAATQPQMTEAELAFLCTIPADLKAYSHVSSIPKDLKAFAAAAERAKSIVWKRLPPAISCGGSERKLIRGTDFLSDVGFSPDGSVAAVSGGYVKGPLHGQGGQCFFIRKEEEWSFLGCRVMWVS